MASPSGSPYASPSAFAGYVNPGYSLFAHSVDGFDWSDISPLTELGRRVNALIDQKFRVHRTGSDSTLDIETEMAP
jgi:hypothetical protein